MRSVSAARDITLLSKAPRHRRVQCDVSLWKTLGSSAFRGMSDRALPPVSPVRFALSVPPTDRRPLGRSVHRGSDYVAFIGHGNAHRYPLRGFQKGYGMHGSPIFRGTYRPQHEKESQCHVQHWLLYWITYGRQAQLRVATPTSRGLRSQYLADWQSFHSDRKWGTASP